MTELGRESPFAVVALSGRALAASGSKAGYRVIVFDIFDDLDTRACAETTRRVSGSVATGFDANELIRVVHEVAPSVTGLVYGSGLESHPALLAALGERIKLFGNAAAVLQRVKDPAWFFALLDRLGIAHPETRLKRPDDPRDWLVKRIGAAGGAHIMNAVSVDGTAAGYYQRRVAGRPVSVLFVTDGKITRVLGFSEQWPSAQSDASPFRFGGAAVPALVPSAIKAEMTAAVEAVAGAIGLIGVNSADMLIHEEGFYLLEINPRPGATVDIFDRWLGMSVFHLHVEAARGRLPKRLGRMPGAFASVIVYADRDIVVPPAFSWPAWAADLPAADTRIGAGAPICTVFAADLDLETARTVACQRVDEMRIALSPAGWHGSARRTVSAWRRESWS